MNSWTVEQLNRQMHNCTGRWKTETDSWIIEEKDEELNRNVSRQIINSWTEMWADRLLTVEQTC